jgi:ferrous iron transport protein B
MWHKSEHYLKKMGGVVLVFSIILWGLSTYPKDRGIEAEYDGRITTVSADASLSPEQKNERTAALEVERDSELIRHTFVGRIGKVLEPLVRPLGFEWRAAVALMTGFVAKEMVVSTMGVLYAVGSDAQEDDQQLRAKMAENFTPLSGLAFMAIVLLYTPCIVALVTLVRELKSLKWSVFSVAYQLALAWLAALVIFQGGRLIGFH